MLQIGLLAGGGRSCQNKSDKKFTFLGNKPKNSVDLPKLSKKEAFSVAEAMITLLIVSVALATMAPFFSKKTSGTGGQFDEKWVYTSNGKDITRPVNNVGIGVDRNNNPLAKLQIKSSDNQNIMRIDIAASQKNAIIEVYNSGKLVTSMDKNGKWSPDSTPADAVMFFRSPNCPTGWAKADGVENSLNLQGRFLRGAGTYSTCGWDGANQRYVNCANPNRAVYNTAYEDAGREIWGYIDLYGQTGVWQESGAFYMSDASNNDGGTINADVAKGVRSQIHISSKYVTPISAEFIPRNIALTPCIKL